MKRPVRRTIFPSPSIPLPARSRLPCGSGACATMNAERVCYVDSSAIVKLVVRERESAALRRYLRGRSLVSSALAGVEVTRAIMPHGARTLRTAREVLSRIEIVRINAKVLSRAATMEPDLRTPRRDPPRHGVSFRRVPAPIRVLRRAIGERGESRQLDRRVSQLTGRTRLSPGQGRRSPQPRPSS